jgi:hypothetical protein
MRVLVPLALCVVVVFGERVRVRVSPPAQGQHALRLLLLDSTTAQWCEGDGIRVWGMEVKGSARRDTLRMVVQPWPRSVGDTMVVGVIAIPTQCDRRLFRYNSADGRISHYNLPPDMWGYFSDVSVSPDARFLLYLAMDRTGNERLVIRRWPAGTVVITGPSMEGCDCDIDRHHAHWVTADSFELGTRVSREELYERVSGSVGARRIHVDTLRTDRAYWHPPFR